MGKASSAKKIKRVQQAGVSRTPGQRRKLGYPALIVGILVVGSVLVYFAREERAVAANEAPVANQDHWHAAFGIDICGETQANPGDAGPDTRGIHTHQDGLIHIHPFVGAAAGENATFQVFAEQTGIEVSDDSLTLPDGQTFRNGDDCEDEDGNKEPGRVAMYVWPPQATEATEPEVVTDDIAGIRFTADGQAFVLAFVPEDAEVVLPASVEALANPIDLETPPEQGSTEFTTTSAPAEGEGTEGSTTTAPAEGDTTTTAPAGDGEQSTTTAAPTTAAPTTTEPGNG
jgi:hypothetical protein